MKLLSSNLINCILISVFLCKKYSHISNAGIPKKALIWCVASVYFSSFTLFSIPLLCLCLYWFGQCICATASEYTCEICTNASKMRHKPANNRQRHSHEFNFHIFAYFIRTYGVSNIFSIATEHWIRYFFYCALIFINFYFVRCSWWIRKWWPSLKFAFALL